MTTEDIDDPDLAGLRGTTRYGPEWRAVGKRLNDAGRAYDAGDIAAAEAILDEVRAAATGTDGEALDIRARAVAAAAAIVGVLVYRCVRRLGGVTGDVMGAAIELAFTVMITVMII